MATCVIQADPQTRNEAKTGFLIMKYTFLGEDHIFFFLFFITVLKTSLFSIAKHISRESEKESY